MQCIPRFMQAERAALSQHVRRSASTRSACDAAKIAHWYGTRDCVVAVWLHLVALIERDVACLLGLAERVPRLLHLLGQR